MEGCISVIWHLTVALVLLQADKLPHLRLVSACDSAEHAQHMVKGAPAVLRCTEAGDARSLHWNALLYVAASCCRCRLPAQGTERIHKLFEEGFEMFRSGVLSVLPGGPSVGACATFCHGGTAPSLLSVFDGLQGIRSCQEGRQVTRVGDCRQQALCCEGTHPAL